MPDGVPATELLYAIDAYAREFDSDVVAVDDRVWTGTTVRAGPLPICARWPVFVFSHDLARGGSN